MLQCVEDVILQQKTELLMKKIHEIYKLHPDDTGCCHKLYAATSRNTSFFQPNNRYFDVVTASDSIEEVLTKITHPQTCITSVAATLRADKLLYCSAIKDQYWPPTVETVTAKYGSSNDSVKLFLNTLLYSGKKNVDKLEALPRLVESLWANFVHAVSKGEIITSKHYLLSLCMHNMTGQKLLIQIDNKLGY